MWPFKLRTQHNREREKLEVNLDIISFVPGEPFLYWRQTKHKQTGHLLISVSLLAERDMRVLPKALTSLNLGQQVPQEWRSFRFLVPILTITFLRSWRVAIWRGISFANFLTTLLPQIIQTGIKIKYIFLMRVDWRDLSIQSSKWGNWLRLVTWLTCITSRRGIYPLYIHCIPFTFTVIFPLSWKQTGLADCCLLISVLH